MLIALSVTGGAVFFAAIILVILFRTIDPQIVRDGYVECAGRWHEAFLCGCEDGLASLPQQPVNTYTNLAYLAAGVFPGVLLDTPAIYVFSFSMIYLFIGSSLYHAMSTSWGGMLDVTAIYVVYSALAVYASAVLFGSPDWMIPLTMFVVAGLAAYVLSPRYHRNMHLKIAILLGGTYVLLLLRMAFSGNWGSWPYLVASIITFALGFLFWMMDKRRTFPLPRWGHGLWHILTAAATGLVFYAIYLSGA
jgi:channel protein (hemolysin III family)